MHRSSFDLSDDDKIYWNLATTNASSSSSSSSNTSAANSAQPGGSATREARDSGEPGAAAPLAASSPAAPQGSGQQYVNLIEFYNTRFIQECKHLLCSPPSAKGGGEGGGGGGGAAQGPPPQASCSTPPQSPLRKHQLLVLGNVSIDMPAGKVAARVGHPMRFCARLK